MIGWCLSFLFKSSLIVGWTITVASFVGRLGIDNLPYLFVAHAFFIILGTLLYAELSQHFKKDYLIIVTAIMTVIFLFLARILINYNDVFFFAFLLLGGSLLMSQLGIFISIFHEELFSPLESVRTFPIIESAETLGGLFAGIMINRLVFLIPSQNFIFFWMVGIFLIIPLIILYNRHAKKIPKLQLKPKESLMGFNFSRIKENVGKLKNIPFLKGMFLIVLMQWVFVNLFEFQYTKAIHQEVVKNEEIARTQESSNSGYAKLSRGIKMRSYEEDLTYDLGSLQIVFSFFALIVQFFVASRIIKNLGIVSSMMVHPMVMIFSSLAMLFRYNFLTAVIAKTGFELSQVIYKNPYNSSFYALPPHFRKQAKEFLEGIAKPIGALIGTTMILLFEKIYLGDNLTLAINATLVAILILLLSQLKLMQNKYTNLSTNHLQQKSTNQLKFESIEILSQKGHRNVTTVLSKILLDPREDREVKIRALEALSKIKDLNSIPEILECLRDQDIEIRRSALECLSKFENLHSYAMVNAFAQYRIFNFLKELFNKENDAENLSLIIKILASFHTTETVDFILIKLQNAKDLNIKEICINACGQFNDPNCAYYLFPYLNHQDLKLRCKTIDTLWKFHKYRSLLKKKIEDLVAKNPDEVLPVLSPMLLQDLKMHKEKQILLSWVEGEDDFLKIKAALALAKLENPKALTVLAEFLLFKKNLFDLEIKCMIKSFAPNLKKKFNDILHQKVCDSLNLR